MISKLANLQNKRCAKKKVKKNYNVKKKTKKKYFLKFFYIFLEIFACCMYSWNKVPMQNSSFFK